MASDWTDSIIVAVTEANVSYIATGADPDVQGFADISGNASISRYSGTEPSRQEFRISLTIRGRSASQVKREATLWPVSFDEVTANDDVIGIVFKLNEFEHRQGHVFLQSAQFDKLLSIMSLASNTGVTLYLRQSAQSGCDLIVRVDFYAAMIAPQS